MDQDQDLDLDLILDLDLGGSSGSLIRQYADKLLIRD